MVFVGTRAGALRLDLRCTDLIDDHGGSWKWSWVSYTTHGCTRLPTEPCQGYQIEVKVTSEFDYRRIRSRTLFSSLTLDRLTCPSLQPSIADNES